MTGALLFTHFYLNSDSRQTSLELFFLSHMVEEFSEKTSDAKEHFDFINTTFESFPYQGCFPQWFSACFFCVSTALGWRTGLLQAEIAPEIDQFQGPSIQRLMLDMCPHVVPLLAWCQWRRSDLISLWSAAQKSAIFFSAFSRGFFVWFTLGQFVTPFIIPQNPFPPKKTLWRCETWTTNAEAMTYCLWEDGELMWCLGFLSFTSSIVMIIFAPFLGIKWKYMG